MLFIYSLGRYIRTTSIQMGVYVLLRITMCLVCVIYMNGIKQYSLSWQFAWVIVYLCMECCTEIFTGPLRPHKLTTGVNFIRNRSSTSTSWFIQVETGVWSCESGIIWRLKLRRKQQWTPWNFVFVICQNVVVRYCQIGFSSRTGRQLAL